MLRNTCLIFFLLMGLTSVKAQNILINPDAPIGNMMERYIELNKSRSRIGGWRVQILATPDRQRLESVKQSFQYRYPSIPVNWEHSAPYYKLRAGAFATKLEALRLKYILQKDYPGIYLVKDDAISPRELIGRY